MSTRTNESRRRFLKTVPVAVAGVVTTDVLAQGQGGAPSGPVTADMVRAAETLDGVKFTNDEENAIARSANQNLAIFTRLRQIAIPQDTEPAYIFKPSLPGHAE